MKYFFLWLVAALFFSTLHAQKPLTAEFLSPDQVNHLFTDSVRQAFNLLLPIRRVYKYADRSGQYYCVLTENIDSITAGGDSMRSKIRAVNLRGEKEGFSKTWELNDFSDHAASEHNIWFWTKYFEFKDYDKDSLVEPLIVYGTLGLNEFDDGRIKFLIYYKGQKIGIRYQGCEEDCRSLTVDKAFYSLPEALQKDVKTKMLLIRDKLGVIYPRGWEEGLKKNKLVIGD